MAVLASPANARQGSGEQELEPAARLVRCPAAGERGRRQADQHDADLDEQQLQEATHAGEVDVREDAS